MSRTQKKKSEVNNITMIESGKASNLNYALKDKETTEVKIVKPDIETIDCNNFRNYLDSLAYYKYLLNEKKNKRKIIEKEITKLRDKIIEYHDVVEYFKTQENFINKKIIEKLPDKL